MKDVRLERYDGGNGEGRIGIDDPSSTRDSSKLCEAAEVDGEGQLLDDRCWRVGDRNLVKNSQ